MANTKKIANDLLGEIKAAKELKEELEVILSEMDMDCKGVSTNEENGAYFVIVMWEGCQKMISFTFSELYRYFQTQRNNVQNEEVVNDFLVSRIQAKLREDGLA